MFRVGLGHDTHRLVPGDGLVIGGITIQHDRRAHGHSDADVLLHAITDALLGAAALGDIGELFPDDDPANKGRDSADMLRAACDRVAAAGKCVKQVPVCITKPVHFTKTIEVCRLVPKKVAYTVTRRAPKVVWREVACEPDCGAEPGCAAEPARGCDE